MPTQQEIAEHLDLSQQTVSELLAEKLEYRFSSLDEIRIAYIRRLRAQAAGRSAVGDLDLAGERARLAKEQADRVAMQNAVTRGELAPVALLEEVLAKAASKVAGIFDAIPGMVRRRSPRLSADDIDLIAGEIARARNIVATLSLANLVEVESADVSTPAAEEHA